MNYNQAIIEASNEKRVKRKCWVKTILFMQPITFISAETVPNMTSLPKSVKATLANGLCIESRPSIIDYSYNPPRMSNYSFTNADKKADDWEVVEEANFFHTQRTPKNEL